jgi:outer membrane protein assembly factor BamD (BamD/ComL family)
MTRRAPIWHAMILALVVAGPAAAQTAIEIKKELFPKWKKAQAEGRDLGEAGTLYTEGDEALKQGLQEEALEYFKQAKEAWPEE